MGFALCSELCSDGVPTLLSIHTHFRQVIQLCPPEIDPHGHLHFSVSNVNFYSGCFLSSHICSWVFFLTLHRSQVPAVSPSLSPKLKKNKQKQNKNKKQINNNKKLLFIRECLLVKIPSDFYLSEVVFIFPSLLGMVWMFVLHTLKYMLKSWPQYDGIWKWWLQQVIRYWRWRPRKFNSCLYRKSPES